MKILIIQDDYRDAGGARGFGFNMVKGFVNKGYNVFVITTVQNRADEGEFEYEGLKIFRIYSKYNGRWRAYLSLYNFQTVRKIRKILDKVKPDVVHAHNIHYYLSYHCLKLAKKSGAKVFLTAHDVMLFHYGKLVEYINSDDLTCPNKFNYKISPWQQIKKYKKRYNPFRNIIIKHYLKYVDRIFTVSNALKDALNQNGIGNIETIHNGINVEDWQADSLLIEEFKKKYNLIDKKIVFSGGRLSDAKGGTKALEALVQVAKEIPNVALLVAGSIDGHAKVMKKQAKDMGIEENLIFTGWIERKEIKVAYITSDVVLIPSICFDSFPTMNLEAMACKKPIIGTCYGGTSEIVVDGVTGYIVNPHNTQKFAEKIIYLLKNPQIAEQFGKAGYERVKTHFNLKDKVEEYVTIFETLLNKEE